jgi:hypothetical protein
MRSAFFLVFVACSSSSVDKPPPREQPASPKPVAHEQRCGGVTATWRGERRGGSDLYTSLTLEIPGVAKPWTRDLLELAPDARTTDLFSPDCRYALILVGREGPYHIVRTDRLAAYVAGARPDFELAGEPDPKGITGTGVFRGGGWVSNTEVAYTWGCCEPPITTHFTIPAN